MGWSKSKHHNNRKMSSTTDLSSRLLICEGKKRESRAVHWGRVESKGEEREKRTQAELLPEFLQSSSWWGTWTEKASRSGASKDSGLRISLSQRLRWSSLVSDGPWISGTSFSLAPSPTPMRQESMFYKPNVTFYKGQKMMPWAILHFYRT